MHRYIKSVPLALLLAVMFVLFLNGSAFADDGGLVDPTPPVTESAGGEIISSETPAADVTPTPEMPATEEGIPSETPSVEITPEPEVTASEPPATEELLLTGTPVAEEPMPNGEFILADGEGDPLVLASTETDELLNGGDPWFMVGTQKYAWVFDPDAGGPLSWSSACPTGTMAGSTCFEAISTNAINAVLTYISTNHIIPTDKKIYVESGTYNETINFNGGADYYLGQLAGLIGVNGSTTTTINGNVIVNNTRNGFTLSGFTINGGVSLYSNNGALMLSDLDVNNSNGDGIYLNDQAGAVTISDVNSSNNAGNGLYFENADLLTPNPLTINNSAFDNNDADNNMVGAGALIYNKGPVTVNGVSASGNSGDGMYIKSQGIVTVKNGVFSDNIEANTNSLELLGEGLLIHNQTNTSAVTLENIQAQGNADTGVWVVTRGPVTAKNIVATHNIWQGMLVSNDFPNSGLYFPTTVSVSDSEFSMNGWHGLDILATGTVTLSFVNANNNVGGGVYIDNCLWKDTVCRGTGTVTISNPYMIPMEFNNNGFTDAHDGLQIISAGAVTITGVSASGNTGNGIYVDNLFPGKTGGVMINVLPAVFESMVEKSYFSSNGFAGIVIYSNGAIAINGTSLNPVVISANTYGIYIGNSEYPTGAAVTIKNVKLNNNTNATISIHNKGAITIDSVFVNQSSGLNQYSHWEGFYLNNSYGIGAISISNASVNDTSSYGFYILSNGAVTLKNISTARTGSSGIYVNNSTAATLQPVTLTDVTAELAHGNGIEIQSKGMVTLNGVSSFNHSGSRLPDSASISLTGKAYETTWFDFQGVASSTVSIRMNISGTAIMQLVDVYAGNVIWSGEIRYPGDFFETGDIVLPTTGVYYVLINWTNEYPRGFDYTLNYILGTNPVSSQLAPKYSGILINNTNGYNSISDVVIQKSTVNPNPRISNNSGYGIQVFSNGNIKLLDTDLYYNQMDGAYLKNEGAPIAKTITASNLDIQRSGQYGLRIYAYGTINMSNINSTENGLDGINAINCSYNADSKSCRGNGPVSLTGTNDLTGNRGTGLYIYTIGMVTLNNIDVYNNYVAGIFINAPLASELVTIPAGGGVTLTASNGFTNTVWFNDGPGIFIYTYGPVSLKNLDLLGNDSYGILIDNHYAATNQSVTITDTVVSHSGDTGIAILSKGTVNLNGVSSVSNFSESNISVNLGYGETALGVAVEYVTINFNVTEGSNLELLLNTLKFAGHVELVDNNHNLLGEADLNYGEGIRFDIGTVASGGIYSLYMWTGSNVPFLYQVSVSDPEAVVDRTYITPIDGIVIINNYGTGDVNIGKTTLSGETTSMYNTGTGIIINTKGNVKVADTIAQDNFYDGIQIDSSTQAKTTTLTNVKSISNGGFGVSIISLGPVTWTGGQVDDNGIMTSDYGVSINNAGAATAAPVSLTKVNVFDSASDGLIINSKGTVSLTDVKIIGNLGNGLYVITKGAINLTRVSDLKNYTPDRSVSYGAYLDNSGYTGLYPTGVTIIDSDFNFNHIGLEIHSTGAVTLQGVNVVNNYDRGQVITIGDVIAASMPVKIRTEIIDYGILEDYGDAYWTFTVTEDNYDLVIGFNSYDIGGWELLDSYGNRVYYTRYGSDGDHYTLYPGEYTIHVWADQFGTGGWYQFGLNANPDDVFTGSNSNGAVIVTNGNVTIARSTPRTSSNFNNNGGNGLTITSTNGTVTLSDLNLNKNLHIGLEVETQGAGKSVTINRMNAVNNFYQNINITSKGAVTWNGGLSDGSLYGTVIDNRTAATQQPVTLTNVSFNNAQRSSGLTVHSIGVVTLTGIEANGNAWHGAHIKNYYGTGAPAVIVNNTSRGGFNNNGWDFSWDGLVIVSNGPVTITNVAASHNTGDGIFIYNNGATTIAYTKDTKIEGNGSYAFYIQSGGAIKLTATNTLDVRDNVYGIYLDNSGVTAPVNVEGITNGVSLIKLNNTGAIGLEILSNGVVTVRNVPIYNSGGTGLQIGYADRGRPSTVNLTNVLAQFNGYTVYPSTTFAYDGIRIFANGPVNLFHVDSNQNAGHGIYIQSTGPVSLKKIIAMWSGMGNPADNLYGIFIKTPGNVMLDSIHLYNNDNNLLVDTTDGTGTITMLGTYFKNIIQYNTIVNGDALYIAGGGNVSLSNLDMRYNPGRIYVVSAGSVNLNNVNVQNNMYGITVNAGTGAKFTNVFSVKNGWWDTDNDGIMESFNSDGLYLQLNGGTASFTDNVFTGNTGSGIEIYFANEAITAPPYPLTLLRTMYFGNDTDRSGDRNLYTRDV